MCLKTVTLKIDEPTSEEHVGYKVVFVRDDKIQPAYYKPTGESIFDDIKKYALSTNEWLVAKSVTEFAGEYEEESFTHVKYQTGFHIFTSIESAQTWRHATHIIQVKYRGVTYHGTEVKDQIVHIAREMFIPWPQVPVLIA